MNFMDQYIKLEHPQLEPLRLDDRPHRLQDTPHRLDDRPQHRPLNQHIRFNQVVRRNRSTIKSILATIVIICYIYTCVNIIYFIYYILYKLV
jgi:hypothetical protein